MMVFNCTAHKVAVGERKIHKVDIAINTTIINTNPPTYCFFMSLLNSSTLSRMSFRESIHTHVGGQCHFNDAADSHANTKGEAKRTDFRM